MTNGGLEENGEGKLWTTTVGSANYIIIYICVCVCIYIYIYICNHICRRLVEEENGDDGEVT